jgi:hypothetical protein
MVYARSLGMAMNLYLSTNLTVEPKYSCNHWQGRNDSAKGPFPKGGPPLAVMKGS